MTFFTRVALRCKNENKMKFFHIRIYLFIMQSRQFTHSCKRKKKLDVKILFENFKMLKFEIDEF